MIKFFRKIRQKLLSEKTISKYILYAIGEIALVVIGILIAVQINSIYQDSSRIESEKVLLTQLRDELTGIYWDIFSDLELLVKGEKSHYKILSHIEKKLPYNDSLCIDFFFLKKDEYVYPDAAVYGKIKTEGLDIIRNDSIRIFTQTLYESLFPRISKGSSFTTDISEYLDAYYLENFRPNRDYDLKFTFTSKADSIGDIVFDAETENFPYEFEINEEKRQFTLGYVPLNFEALKNDPKFLMLLNEVDGKRAYKISRYIRTKEVVRIIVRLINDDLEHSF